MKYSFNEKYEELKIDAEKRDLSRCERYTLSGEDLNKYELKSGVNHKSLGAYKNILFDDDAYYEVWVFTNDRDYYSDDTVVRVEPAHPEQLTKKIVRKTDWDKEISAQKSDIKSIRDLEREIERNEESIKNLRKRIKEIEEADIIKSIYTLCVNKKDYNYGILLRRKIYKGNKLVETTTTPLTKLPVEEFKDYRGNIGELTQEAPVEIELVPKHYK